MNLSQNSKEEQMKEHGRVIARGMAEIAVEKEKNMMKAARRKETMLENAAERVLSGKDY